MFLSKNKVLITSIMAFSIAKGMEKDDDQLNIFYSNLMSSNTQATLDNTKYKYYANQIRIHLHKAQREQNLSKETVSPLKKLMKSPQELNFASGFKFYIDKPHKQPLLLEFFKLPDGCKKVSLIKRFISSFKPSLTVTNWKGQNLFHELAQNHSSDRPYVISSLLSGIEAFLEIREVFNNKGSNVNTNFINQTDTCGHTPLYYLVSQRPCAELKDSIQLFLEYGSDASVENIVPVAHETFNFYSNKSNKCSDWTNYRDIVTMFSYQNGELNQIRI